MLNLFGNQTANLDSTTLDNAGTINLTSGSNSFRLYYSTIQNNSGGVFDLQNDGSAFLNIYGSGSFVNNAGATLRKSRTPGFRTSTLHSRTTVSWTCKMGH